MHVDVHSDFVLHLMLLGVLVRGHPVGPRWRVRNESNRLVKDRRGVTFKHFRSAPLSAVTAELSRSPRNYSRFPCLIGPLQAKTCPAAESRSGHGREPFHKPSQQTRHGQPKIRELRNWSQTHRFKSILDHVRDNEPHLPDRRLGNYPGAPPADGGWGLLTVHADVPRYTLPSLGNDHHIFRFSLCC